MVPIFGRGSVTATSAVVESEFADLKDGEFRGEIPMRMDRFVIQHLERINNKIKEHSKPTDGLLQNREKLSKVPDKAGLNEFSGAHSTSKAEELLNSMEVDDLHDITPDNISFDVTAHNVAALQTSQSPPSSPQYLAAS
ncbi:unnamed protein product [Euphydryas editha]|uniref:Uncharacterized protein n=1 Tax=Euphydryas editha TaxID=104508 RepID=A0AAU9TPE5_EUPED|nr:unnamed protein product [Euphydryas editha]